MNKRDIFKEQFTFQENLQKQIALLEKWAEESGKSKCEMCDKVLTEDNKYDETLCLDCYRDINPRPEQVYKLL